MKRANLRIVERHADEAAFLWERRDRAARSPIFDLESLGELDSRLDANLEGLVIAEEHGLAAVVGELGRSEERGSELGGELFAAVFVAAELGESAALAKLLVLAQRQPRGVRSVVSALGWLSADRAEQVLGEMSEPAAAPWLHELAIAAYGARREDPGERLVRALESAEASVRGRAFRAAAALGRRDVLPILRREMSSAGEAAPWAAWAAALLGDSGAAPRLWRLAEGASPFAEAASAMAARVSDAASAASHLHALARAPEHVPAALAGAAARGDAVCLPWVLEAMSRPEWAHRAAWTYATITGAELAAPLASRQPTLDVTDEDLARRRADVARDLPSPDPGAIAAHWARVEADFPPGERFLGGRRLGAAWLEECLRTGAQPRREAAAAELVRLRARDVLFPVHAPAHVQAERLGIKGTSQSLDTP